MSIEENPKLLEVVIRGYKSISYKQPVTLSLGDVNILLGANGAGKSNIISFFRMLGYMMSRSFARYVESVGTANALLYYGIKNTPKMTGEFLFQNNGYRDQYQCALTHAAPDRLIITEETILSNNKEIGWSYKKTLEPIFKESALVESNNGTARRLFHRLCCCKVYQFHDSSTEGPLRQACPIETANYLQAYGNNLPSFLLLLKRQYPDSYNRIVRYVRDVVPQFDDFYLEPVGDVISLRWKDTSPTDYRFTAHQFSDGSIRFIALATLLLQPKETMPKVVIIDEPELGLHPLAIAKLAEMIKDASIHSQIIVATQSKDLVDYFDINDISVVEMDSEEHCTRITKLRKEDYALWIKNYSNSELWDKNIIGGRPV